MWMLAGLFSVAAAQEVEIPDWSGDLALAYGRNWGQELMVGALAGEVKRNVDPRAAIGLRMGSTLGVGIDAGQEVDARGFFGVPVLLKGEVFPSVAEMRPFAGLGAGVTFATGRGAVVDLDDGFRSAGYSAGGPMVTLMPEIGLDIGLVRIALNHAFLVGSARETEDSLVGVEGEFERPPGFSGTALQVGLHFGGPDEDEYETVGVR